MLKSDRNDPLLIDAGPVPSSLVVTLQLLHLQASQQSQRTGWILELT